MIATTRLTGLVRHCAFDFDFNVECFHDKGSRHDKAIWVETIRVYRGKLAISQVLFDSQQQHRQKSKEVSAV
jgi:hypothetical protein